MDIRDLIPIGMFIITVVGIIGTVFKAKGMDEAQQKAIDEKLRSLNEIDDRQWKKIDQLILADIAQEKEGWKMKSELELKIASLDGVVGKIDGKMDHLAIKIDEMQESISHRLEKIEVHFGKS